MPPGGDAELAIARRRVWLVGALVVAGVAIAGGWTGWQNRRYRQTIAAVEGEMAAGRHAIAARRLMELQARTAGSDEAAYLLGVCEKARGRNQAALEAWARVTPGSSFSSRAIEARLTLEVERGRFAAAEQLVSDAAGDPRNDRTGLRILLLPTFTIEGRDTDARQLVVERWQHLQATGEGTSELAINLARLHIELQAKPNPVEFVRAELDRAASLAPDDDRVWLGRANLAITTGNHDQAQHWLNACERLRPDDAPVWRARLNWGVASGRVEEVERAITHLRGNESMLAQNDRIGAWLAARRGDHRAERQALERVVAAEPADMGALNRLAELARHEGPVEQLDVWKRQRTEIDGLNARYQKLFDRNQPIRDAVEMGRLAARLGGPFEARIFLTVAAAEGFDQADAQRELERLNQRLPSNNETGKGLAELFPDRTGAMAPQTTDRSKEEEMLNHENHEITRKNAN